MNSLEKNAKEPNETTKIKIDHSISHQRSYDFNLNPVSHIQKNAGKIIANMIADGVALPNEVINEEGKEEVESSPA